MSGSAKATVLIDNERVIVTEYRFRRDQAFLAIASSAPEIVLSPMVR